MYVRCAFFEGRVKPGMDDAFHRFVTDNLMPLWTQFPGADEVRVLSQRSSDTDLPQYAMVLAIKELILCWSGAALRVGGKVYAVGDRIQIAGHRGVVLDHDMFATKLLEIGPGQSAHLYTGRVTVFPNSLLFTNPLVKENPEQDYGLYTVVVPIKHEDNWQRSERILLEAAKVECAPFMEEAVRHMKLLEQANLLEAI